MRVLALPLFWLLFAAHAAYADDWVDGPEAPLPTSPIAPATAPRDGDPTNEAPTEPLQMPPRPPEDRRVETSDGLPVSPAPLRAFVDVNRRTLTNEATLDLDSAWPRLQLPGVVFVPTSAGAARPVARGHGPGQFGVVVDGVPFLGGGGGFGVAVSETEVLSLVGMSRLRLRQGAQAFSSVSSSQAGLIEVDTGGALTELGESMRTDGLLSAGVGGADVEKGAQGLVRTGWRTLRVLGHGTVLQRDDLRPGRIDGVLAPSSTEVQRNSGGAGGMVGARVDVVPVERSRVFVSYLAGRGLDVDDPATCGDVDADNRVRDCLRTRERGVDAVIVGGDVARDAGALTIVPGARVHVQRALSEVERSGRALSRVDLARDEVVRGGVTLSTMFVSDMPLFWTLRPTLEVALDGYADRASSSFFERSLNPRDAIPRGDGLRVDDKSNVRDGAVARQGIARARARLENDMVAFEVGSRLQALAVTVPPHGDDELEVTHTAFAPSFDTTARLRLTEHASMYVAGAVVERGDDATALSRITPAALGATRGSERSAEVGVVVMHPGVDVSAVVFGALRAPVVAADSGFDEGVLGMEAMAVLKPDVDGLTVTATVAGVIIDSDVFTEGQGPKAGVIQPQVSVQARYAPTTWPVGVTARAWGALPHARLSASEVRDPVLCPEQAGDIPRGGFCSGVPGFAMVDVAAFMRLGQLRFDVSGENALDVAGRFRGASFAMGGATVRLRLTWFL